ncbi:glycogen/starch synthase [Candidatus Cardinium hertigii]|uniref:starch synthase n=1 Tax=Candidatus Cardinium hertigii TaxID=247481 RepID=A0A2Z3LH34_9BACT|nr:glycogen/starch synthase [Candidatus Cardinium hertigii]AWN81360.1 Glycogen synthase [Candidatus Cardinium hertigii]
MSLQRILYVASEVAPFLETSLIASCLRKLPEAMQHKQLDVRIIVPKFGVIHDRLNRLHEVLRLSGNIVSIDAAAYAITVKVSTIPNVRLQVYFVDNEVLFGCRKAVFQDASNYFFADNDLRMIFFCMGVMETLKKLEWEADVVHCHGWITSLLPLFWKKLYQQHALFTKAKLITTLYNTTYSNHFPLLANRIEKIGISVEDMALLATGNFCNIIELAMQYSDLVLRGEMLNEAEFKKLPKAQACLLVPNDEQYSARCLALYHELLGE